ncbi:exosome complex component RRP43-like isoform X2 [Xenia sp. Carnegie-2017]|uniref:exosome complex component RRP43-like isoform X2 n=1 Tax=Xenia sp. Carnegie-2017 TaxID=2897299 RepID=UPI001F03C149|nr:exosome complex component RRP43-like isoform X2 [Xenia sp. Carnegie-2017]XP_046852929.1 exosome complex component RRP43-like isoform X2 [Xenia sp. Carnegie-2017]
MATGFKTAQPLEYYRKFLSENIRPDGRDLLQFRNTVVNIGSIATAEGSCIVKLGNTTVVCGIKAELANPKSDYPKWGFIVPNIDLSALCSPRFRPGPPSEQAQVISQFIADTISNSKMIDLEALCIMEGQLVWCLYVDLVCLNYDGNIVDASIIAMLGAIYNTRLYEIFIDEEKNVPVPSDEKQRSLIVKEVPVASTFAVIDNSLAPILIADPTDDEESLASGVITIVATTENKLCSLHKPGGRPLPAATLRHCIEEAKKRAKNVHNLIEAAL